MSNPHNNSYFFTYLREINQRVVYIIISWCACLIYSYWYCAQIIYCIVKPLSVKGIQDGSSPHTVPTIHTQGASGVTPLDPGSVPGLDFIYTNVSEAFYATLSACFITSTVAIIPLVIYQGWCFLIPSRYRRERVLWNKRILATTAYAATIMWLLVTLLLPRVYGFLHLFAVSSGVLRITLEARIAPYLTWIFSTLFLFLLLAISPLVIYMALKNNTISAHFLLKNRRTTLYLICISAALVSPPDIWSQFVLTGFVYAFFEGVVWYYLYTLQK